MKIGILTFHKSINNGAVIQCYSLSKRIKKEFPDVTVEVINYHMPKVDSLYSTSYRTLFKGSFKKKIHGLYTLMKDPFYIKHLKQRERAFCSVDNYIPLSSETIYSNKQEELIKYINNRYDIVIAGSDAIWNYVLRGFPNPYFLSDKIKCHKMSYAASCYGMNYENIPINQKEQIKKILDTYDFIGTRDSESDNFLKSINCSVTPHHTCDPTVFLDVNDLPIDEKKLKEKLKRKKFDFDKKTIAVMGTDKLCKYIKSMYSDEYQIVSLYNYCSSSNVNLHDLTPYEWAYSFRFYKVTVTTFFHGTLLSLRNGTPVISIALINNYSKVHTTKVEDLLRRLDLVDNYFHLEDYSNIEIKNNIKEKIDYYIKNNVSEILINKMDKESETCSLFIDKLNNLINKQ